MNPSKTEKPEVKTSQAEVKPQVAKKAVKIEDTAIPLLFKTTGKKDALDRPIGLTHKQIVAEVLKVHPKAKTTVGCISWYQSKVKAGFKACPAGKTVDDLPMRPRVEAS